MANQPAPTENNLLGNASLALGIAWLFGGNRSRATAVAGLILGGIGVCLFLGVMATVGG